MRYYTVIPFYNKKPFPGSSMILSVLQLDPQISTIHVGNYVTYLFIFLRFFRFNIPQLFRWFSITIAIDFKLPTMEKERAMD
jgi:hypothetical protein